MYPENVWTMFREKIIFFRDYTKFHEYYKNLFYNLYL